MPIVKINLGGTIVEMEKEAVSSAIEAGELTIETSNLMVLDKSTEPIVYTKDEHEKFIANTEKTIYETNKNTGEEMAVKKFRDDLSLSFEGKTVGNLLEAYKAKIISEANIKPTEKIQELERDLGTLRTNYSGLQSEYDTFKTTITEKETRGKKDNTLLKFIPDNLIVSKDIALMALKAQAGIDVDFSETGTPLQMINGQLQKDKSLEPLLLNKDFLTESLKTLGLLKASEGGPGGGDEPGGGASGGYAAFIKEMESNDTPQGSLKFQEELNKRIAAKTIDMSK